MKLIDRVLSLEVGGGRWGLGCIRAEADLHPDDWHLVCHFKDDNVMPGTLMYECCLHTLRVMLLRLGWVAPTGSWTEPVPGVAGVLQCRGQVTASTRKAQYEVHIKELGYGADGEPFAVADALMYADGRLIVRMKDMSLRLRGTTRPALEDLWSKPRGAAQAALFGPESILAFAVGKPSAAFGEPYRIFDEGRVIARLPGPPYQFLDRIVGIKGCAPFKLAAGGEVAAEYDVPADAWYFAANRQRSMPFGVLLEVALQPCGWLSAYVGSALASETDLSYRNLGGKAVLHREVFPDSGTMTTRIKMTKLSQSVGMIIQHFDFDIRDARGPV
jgi:3-hydroxymyristoyl/3-hydroxydecanoyl-(acyl carrier protein) dehydratase